MFSISDNLESTIDKNKPNKTCFATQIIGNSCLKSGDRFMPTSTFHNAPGCGYWGMAKNATLICMEKGILQDYRVVSEENLCNRQLNVQSTTVQSTTYHGA